MIERFISRVIPKNCSCGPWPRVPFRFLIQVLLLIVCPAAATSEAFVHPDGRVAIEVDSMSESETKLDVTGRLELVTKRVKKLKAIIEVEASVYDREIVPKDMYIDYKLTKRMKLTLGYNKKILGLEYEMGKKHRLSVHRSPIYQKMEELGIVGRQINLRFLLKPKKKNHGAYFVGAIGGDNSRDYNVQLSLHRRLNNWGYGLWMLLEAHRIDGDFIPVLAESLAVWYQSEKWHLVLECFHGVDAERTEFEKNFGTTRSVQFLGPKLEMAINFALGKHAVLTPLFQISFWMDDLINPKQNTIQFLAGINLQIRGLRFSFNGETHGVNDVNKPGGWSFDRRSFYGEIIYFF